MQGSLSTKVLQNQVNGDKKGAVSKENVQAKIVKCLRSV